MSWPDSIPHHLLVQLIRKYFPFQSIGLDSFRKLPSYCDAMYYFTGTLAAPKARQEEFVLKLLNPEDSKDLDIQNGLARLGRHITGKGFTCPCPVQSHAGNLVVLQRSTLLEYLSTGIMGDLVSSTGADSSDEPCCCVSIYRYIPGKIDSDRVMKHSPQFLYKTGSYVASLDKQLMGFTHKGLEERYNLAWSLSMLLTQRERKLQAVKDVEKLQVLNKILDNFQNHVLPVMNASETLKGLIHNDIHPGNIVLTQADSKGEFEINGIIDFWDCLHGPYLFELGIAIAGHMFNRKDPIAYVKPFLQGYLAVLCLTQSSLDVLYYVVLGRLAQMYINSVTSIETDPMNEYVLALVHLSWLLIDKLMSSGIENCYKTWFGPG